MTRKEELQAELAEIRAKEIEAQLLHEEDRAGNADAIIKLKDAEAKRLLQIKKEENEQDELKRSWWAHSVAWFGDFVIKLGIAFSISYAFLYIVYQGSMAESSSTSYVSESSSGYFQLLSVVGPLFGMVLSYYFGKSKASVNGE